VQAVKWRQTAAFTLRLGWLRRADALVSAPLLDAALSRKSTPLCSLSTPTNLLRDTTDLKKPPPCRAHLVISLFFEHFWPGLSKLLETGMTTNDRGSILK
jgi:hypothetical protein